MDKVNSNSGLLMSDFILLKLYFAEFYICKKDGRTTEIASLSTLLHANIMLHPIS